MTTPRYRKDIDGLRALAVLPVLLFHAGIPGFSGGFVGVDVFFVISGFLITGILLSEYDEGRFSYKRFYERRARRILPALFVVLLATMIPAYFFMVPDQSKDFSLSLLAVVGFVSNFYFMADTGYFAAVAAEKPLLHTWSLGVEEQYYLLIPLLIAAWGGARHSRLLKLLWGLAILSFALACVGLWIDAEKNFFFTLSRFWELMVGSLLGYASQRQRWPEWMLKQAQALSWLGLAMIVGSITLLAHDTPSPSPYMLFPVLGAALIIATAHRNTGVGRLLSWRPLVGIGLISYSAYLWHQPLFAMARIINIDEPGMDVFAMLIVATLVLAAITWKWVEQPFRQPGRVSVRKLVWVLSAGALLIVSVAWMGYQHNPISHPSLLRHRKLKQVETWKVFIENPQYQEMFKSFEPAPQGQRLLIVGDSHSKDLFNALFLYRDQYQGQYQFRQRGYSQGCLEDAQLSSWNGSSACRLDVAFPELYAQADWVVLSFRWAETSLPGVVPAIRYWQSQGKRVVITGRTAEFTNSPKLLHSLFFEHGMQMPNNDVVAQRFAQQRNRSLDDLNSRLQHMAQQAGAVYLDKLDYACDTQRQQCWGLTPSLAPVHYDYGHTTLEGAQFLGQKIRAQNWLAPLAKTSGAGGEQAKPLSKP